MWVVTGTGQSGEKYVYEVPAPLSTDKMTVAVSAYQKHGANVPDDPMGIGAQVEWRSDNVIKLDDPIEIESKANYTLEYFDADEQVWVKVGARAFRRIDAIERALEEESSNNPDLHYRIRASINADRVIGTSKGVNEDLHFLRPKEEEESAVAEEDKPPTKRRKAADKAA